MTDVLSRFAQDQMQSGVQTYIKGLKRKRREKDKAREEEEGEKVESPWKPMHQLNALSGVPISNKILYDSPTDFGPPNVSGRGQRDFFDSLHALQKLSTGATSGVGTIRGTRLGKGRSGPQAPRRGAKSRPAKYGKGTKGKVRSVASKYGWDQGREWRALQTLVHKESSWRPGAANPTSSARGLFQKMTSIHGPVERSVKGQAKWGLKYIKGRYGSPSKALAFHLRNNWY